MLSFEASKEPFDYITIDGKVLGMYGELRNLWFEAVEIGQKLVDYSFGVVTDMIKHVYAQDLTGYPKPGGTRYFISEKGLIYLLMQCDKPNADNYRNVIVDILMQRRALLGQNAKEFWEEVGQRVEHYRGLVDPDAFDEHRTHSFLIPNFYDSHGHCVVLQYYDGKLQTIVTRGNGLVGIDVTNAAFEIPSIPKKIGSQGLVIVVGHIYCYGAKLSDVLEILKTSITYERFSFVARSVTQGRPVLEELGFQTTLELEDGDRIDC